MNQQMALLPWSGMPNVTCTLTRTEDGTVTGRLVIQLPQGGEPITLQATANEKAIEAWLKARYARQIEHKTKTEGAVAGWGFLKKIGKIAKKIVRSKVVRKLAKGFKGVMETPLIGPALGAVFPPAAVTYATMKGAEALGISPWQAQRMKNVKNPRVRKALATKLRARAQVLNRLRWQAAQRRASGGGGGLQLRRRPNPAEARAIAALRQRGVIAGDAAVADAAVAGLARNMATYGRALLHRARHGQPRARRMIAMLNARAKAGNADAIRGRRILLEIAKELNVPYVAGTHAGYEPGMHGAGDVLTIAGNDAWAEDPYVTIGADRLSGAMSLANYYNIVGDDNGVAAAADALAPYAQPISGWGPYSNGGAAQSAWAGPQQNYGAGQPFLSIQGDQHTHSVQLPNFRCSPMQNPVPTSPPSPAAAAGAYPLGDRTHLVVGADGKTYQKSWNGWRWIWSELRPHLGVRGETQGFGLRDALLLGMQQIQQRELRH